MHGRPSSWTWARICSSPPVILVVGWWVSAALGRWVRRMATRSSKIDPTIVPMFYSTVVWTVRIFADRRAGALRGADGQPDRRARRRQPWAWPCRHAAEHRGGHHAADPASGAHRRVRRPEHRRRGHGRGSRPVPDAPRCRSTASTSRCPTAWSGTPPSPTTAATRPAAWISRCRCAMATTWNWRWPSSRKSWRPTSSRSRIPSRW